MDADIEPFAEFIADRVKGAAALAPVEWLRQASRLSFAGVKFSLRSQPVLDR
jgi:hypothetical protein